MMPSSILTSHDNLADHDGIAGIAINGVVIKQALRADAADPFFPKSSSDGSSIPSRDSSSFDICLGFYDDQQRMYHYKSLSPCLFDSPSTSAKTLCSENSQCSNDITNFMV
jgi:hypothetical protein